MNWSSVANETEKGIFTTIISFWQVWVMLIIIVLARVFVEMWLPRYIKKKKIKKKINQVGNWNLNRDLLKNLKKMRPNEFEHYIAEMYLRLGYKTEKVGSSYDGGIDVIATKDNIKHYIQCKKYITSKVSVGDVRDFAGALMDKLSEGKGIFITTNIFTTEAEKYAEDKPIELIDGDELLKLIRMANKESEITKHKEIAICSTCGGKLFERNGKYGKFWGCENYPKCKFTKK